MKTKLAAIVASIGGLCALCCVLPIAGMMGLGALEAFFCDSPFAFWMGIGLMTAGLGYLLLKLKKKWNCSAPACATSCDCKAA